MNEQIQPLVEDLQNASQRLSIVLELYQENLNYFEETDRLKINEFKVYFERKHKAIDKNISSLVRFLEKSFAPSEEEIYQEAALQKLLIDFPDFTSWDENIKQALIEREIKTLRTQGAKRNHVIHPLNTSVTYQDNAEPEKPHSINENFIHCKPYKIEYLGYSNAVHNWKDVLCSLADALYSTDAIPLQNYIANDRNRVPTFSYTILPNYKRPLEIVNGIFTDANRSATRMLTICKKLLHIYAANETDVKIYLSKIAK